MSGAHAHFRLALRARDGDVTLALRQTKVSIAGKTLEINVSFSVAPLVFAELVEFAYLFYDLVFTSARRYISRKNAEKSPSDGNKR